MRKEPKRYLLTISLTPDGSEFRTDFYQDPEGQFIDYDDYAKLQEENARLKAEVERLTKAGDAMAKHALLQHFGLFEYLPIGWKKLIPEWNAAKDGKDAQ